MEKLGALCLHGHVLNSFETNRAGFTCDECSAQQPLGAHLWSCRQCNYDICVLCKEKKSHSQLGGQILRLSMGSKLLSSALSAPKITRIRPLPASPVGVDASTSASASGSMAGSVPLGAVSAVSSVELSSGDSGSRRIPGSLADDSGAVSSRSAIGNVLLKRTSDPNTGPKPMAHLSSNPREPAQPKVSQGKPLQLATPQRRSQFGVVGEHAAPNQQTTQATSLIRDPIKTCPQGHLLASLLTPEQGYTCDSCRRLLGRNTPGWSCRPCNYDVCMKCHGGTGTPKPTRAPTVRLQTPLCPQNHALNGFVTPNDDWECDKCGKVFPQGTLLWSCRPCNYDICTPCKSQAQVGPRRRVSIGTVEADYNKVAWLSNMHPDYNEDQIAAALHRCGGDVQLASQSLRDGPPDLMRDAEGWFRHFDLDGDCLLSPQEIGDAILQTFLSAKRADVEEWVKENWRLLDHNNSGMLEMDEFMLATENRAMINRHWNPSGSATHTDEAKNYLGGNPVAGGGTMDTSISPAAGTGHQATLATDDVGAPGGKDSLVTDSLHSVESESAADEAMARFLGRLPDDGVLGLYFAAKLGEPFDGFGVTLMERYTTYRNKPTIAHKFDVLFISVDHDEKVFDAHRKGMPWVVLPFSRGVRKRFIDRFSVQAIPSLVIVDKHGCLLNSNGVEALLGDPGGDEFPWRDISSLPDVRAASRANEEGDASSTRFADVVRRIVSDEALAKIAQRVPLEEGGYQRVAAYRSNYAMKCFTKRILDLKGWCLGKGKEEALSELMWNHSGVRGKQSFARLLQDLQEAPWVMRDLGAGVPSPDSSRRGVRARTWGGDLRYDSSVSADDALGMVIENGNSQHQHTEVQSADPSPEAADGTSQTKAADDPDEETDPALPAGSGEAKAKGERPLPPSIRIVDADPDEVGSEALSNAATPGGNAGPISDDKSPTQAGGDGEPEVPTPKANADKGNGHSETEGESKDDTDDAAVGQPGAGPGQETGKAAGNISGKGPGKGPAKGPGKGPGKGVGKKGKDAEPSRPEREEWVGKKVNTWFWKRRLKEKDLIEDSAFKELVEGATVDETALDRAFVKSDTHKGSFDEKYDDKDIVVNKTILWSPTEKLASKKRRENLGIKLKRWDRVSKTFLERLKLFELQEILSDPEFSPDQFEVLLGVVRELSPEDWAKLNEENAQEKYEWSSCPEGFLKELQAIPRFRFRLFAMENHLRIDQNVLDLTKRVEAVEHGLRVVKESDALRVTFQKLLDIGNCLNAGNAKLGRADGFDVVNALEAHLLAGAPKCADGKTTLLEHLRDSELSDSDRNALAMLGRELRSWSFPNGPEDPRESKNWIEPTDLGQLQNDHGQLARDLAGLETLLNQAIKKRAQAARADSEEGLGDCQASMSPTKSRSLNFREMQLLRGYDEIIDENRRAVDGLDIKLERLKEDLLAVQRYLLYEPPKNRALSPGQVLGAVSKFTKDLGQPKQKVAPRKARGIGFKHSIGGHAAKAGKN